MKAINTKSHNNNKNKVNKVLSNDKKSILEPILEPILETILESTILESNNSNSSNSSSNNSNNSNNHNPIDDFFGSINESQNTEIKSKQNALEQLHLLAHPIQKKRVYTPIPILVSNSKLKISKSIIFSYTEIKSKIEHFSENELCEIFKIIRNNSEKYTTNKNGIFININLLKKCTLHEISNFIIFCETNNLVIEQEEQSRDIYRECIS